MSSAKNGRSLVAASLFTASVAASLASLTGAAMAVPYPRASTPQAVDLGTTAISGAATATVTVALKLRDTDALQALLESTYTPGSADFHKFLTPEEFSARFGPAPETIAQVTQKFTAAGLQVARSGASHLKVTGSLAAIQAAFGVTLHSYQVAATATTPGYRFQAPAGKPQIAPEIAASVQAVFGLDTRPRFSPHLRHAVQRQSGGASAGAAPRSDAPATTDAPGLWTVVDFAQYYDVTPLYAQGLSGRHQTVGIVTLASFTQSDAYEYWHALHLPVHHDRIREIEVDGGSGPPSDDSGSIETSIDVEQSGGIAPAAKVLVYEAPNTEQGFIDDFAAAIEDNLADTISVSWGEWEYLDLISPVTDPTTGATDSFVQALDNLFIQAALQGQSMFAASGDSGAYDANDDFPVPTSSKILSVDSPASQRYVTAAGGTTLAGPQTYAITSTEDYTVTIPTEQAWGWDYLIEFCKLLGYDPISCGIYPAGSGGGVSSYIPRPSYQQGIPGIINSPTHQTLIEFTPPPPQFIVALPGNFPGRNVPDVSFNADPQTGYIVYYTSSVTGFSTPTYGGTSFVGPQLNGVTSLFDQALGGRIGLLNFPLYDLVRKQKAYGGPNAPLRDIVHGDNWYFKAHPGYDQTTGVGVPDVANLLKSLQW